MAWVQPWKQPTWQRWFLSLVFWEGVLLTPLAAAYAYDTSGDWKLIAAALPILSLFLNVVQRYGPRGKTAGEDGGADPAMVRIRSADRGDKGAEELRFKIMRVAFIAPADAGDQAEYESFCQAMDLDQPAGGWGVVCCEKEDGERWAGLTPDAANLQEQLNGAGAGLHLSQCKIQEFRPGWPDEWDLLKPAALPPDELQPGAGKS